jgi:hypothetical protein
MKTVISVRLCTERIIAIDRAARLLRMNRSQAIDAALRVFPDLVSGKCELKFEPNVSLQSYLRSYNARSE